jgi:hypothetical protein
MPLSSSDIRFENTGENSQALVNWKKNWVKNRIDTTTFSLFLDEQFLKFVALVCAPSPFALFDVGDIWMGF